MEVVGDLPEPVHLAQGRQLTLTALTLITYCTTCSGAFGIEPLVSAIGPGWAVVMLFVAPLLWSLPISLMAAELGTLMPEEGGYYVWVREALGPFWGVQVAWWSLGYSAVNMAIWPVLFVNYLSYLVPWVGAPPSLFGMDSAPLVRWLIAILVIVSSMAVNLRGARGVGRSAEIGSWFVMGAFLLMVGIWLSHGDGPARSLALVRHDLGVTHKGALLLGLSILILNYSGWDTVSTFANEVQRPRRNYPLALGGALLLAVFSYVLPVLAGVSVTTDSAFWSADTGWPAIAGLIGGHWLGVMLATAGLASTWGLFNSQLLYVSRVPYVMACDGWLPKSLSKAQSITAVPRASVIGFCAVIALLALFSFGNLVVMMCLSYTAMLVLEFTALVVFRAKRPHANRSFRVPFGILGLVYVCVAPMVVAAAVIGASLRDGSSYGLQIGIIAALVVSGSVLYLYRHKRAAVHRAEVLAAHAAALAK